MAADNNTTLTHLYGVFGIIPAVIGLVFLVKTDAPWQQYALLLSGWVTCVPLWLMLIKCVNHSRIDAERIRSDAEVIGELRERINGLEKLVESRGETMDVLASLVTGRTATPRARPAPAQHEDEQ